MFGKENSKLAAQQLDLSTDHEIIYAGVSVSAMIDPTDVIEALGEENEPHSNDAIEMAVNEAAQEVRLPLNTFIVGMGTPGKYTSLKYGFVKLTPPIELFLVGRWPEDKSQPWEVQGIYDDKDTADNACADERWFVMPIEKNTPLPLTTTTVGYYPTTEPK
jgi:hypothetical protein